MFCYVCYMQQLVYNFTQTIEMALYYTVFSKIIALCFISIVTLHYLQFYMFKYMLLYM